MVQRQYEADELVVWNTHARIDAAIAKAHIAEYAALTPLPTISSPTLSSLPTSSTEASKKERLDLDNADELAVRALILGVCHRTVGEYEAAHRFLEEAAKYQEDGKLKVNTWVAGLAYFEMAVDEIKEYEASEKAKAKEGGGSVDTKRWEKVLKGASARLDRALHFSGSAIDLSSRLDSRVSMLRDEIVAKKAALGIH